MKNINTTTKKGAFLTLATILSFSFITPAQVITAVPCDMLGMSVNVGSQETMISIYHSGQYMTHPQSENIFMWEFTDQQGNIVHQDTLVDESTISFGHSWSLSDTINVTVHFVNDSANTDNWDINQGLPPNGNSINCLFEDQIYWETGDPTPWGSWTFIQNNPGVDVYEPPTCIDANQIDPTVFCAEIFEPVCGCDGITYSNSCEATFIGGVTTWEDGPCIAIEYGGCIYPLACNYDPNAFFDDGTCTFPPNDCAWPDTWASGCTYSDAINYDVSAATDDGSCIWSPCSTCPGDLNGDGVVAIGDLLGLLAAFGSSCDEINEPNYSIEGKWTFGNNNLNTMYIYEDGVRYTYYCVEEDCESLYNSYEANDGNHIPEINYYTFENDILTIDLNSGNELVTPVTFECDGGEAYFEMPGYSLFRLNSNCE
jgi:hypothetical protein